MIYALSTKRGLGLELWGTYDDLNLLYEVVGNFWNDEIKINAKGSKNRDALISSFSYEIRHTYQGDRMKSDINHLNFQTGQYLGCRFSWVHIFFSLAALKYNMRFKEISKLDTATFLLLEYWIEKCLQSFDKCGDELVPYIQDAIYPANEYIYHYMRTINAEYFNLGGGKKGFKKLPQLLRKSVFGTIEYYDYLEVLKNEAKRLDCRIDDLEINDNHIDYSKIVW